MRFHSAIIGLLSGLLISTGASAQTIIIDAGHGGDDQGYFSWTGHPEAELALRIATRLENRLSGLDGLDILMTRSGEGGPSDETRLAIANAAGADLLLSIHADVATERASAAGLIIYRVSSLSRRTVLARTREMGFAGNDVAASTAFEARLALESDFIDTLRAHIAPDIPFVVDNGRGALFDILMDANTPSLFLEFPYLSNSDSESPPALTEAQIAVIDTVADAIADHYMAGRSN